MSATTLDVSDIKNECESIVDVRYGEHVRTYRRSADGTHFHVGTHPGLCYALEQLRRSVSARALVVYGNPITKEIWGDADRCYIGRSRGEVKIPLVFYNSRSTGGGALLDHCVIGVYHSRQPYSAIWEHPNFEGTLKTQWLAKKEAGEFYIRG